MSTQSVTMPPGTYYVGDLCYLVEDSLWMAMCARFEETDYNFTHGEFHGAKFASSNTMWGDGGYEDQFGNQYGVDAGIIGCMQILDDDSQQQAPIGLSNVVKFDKPFEFIGGSGDYRGKWDGVIHVGHLQIKTDDSGDCDDEDV